MDACLDYLRKNGAEPALVIDPHTVVTAPWTTFKCQFGCENFGKNHCCPPEAPDYTRTRAVLDSFSTGILFRVHHWNATAMAAEGARRLFSGRVLQGPGLRQRALQAVSLLRARGVPLPLEGRPRHGGLRHRRVRHRPRPRPGGAHAPGFGGGAEPFWPDSGGIGPETP